jgi:hypothetical protein
VLRLRADRDLHLQRPRADRRARAAVVAAGGREGPCHGGLARAVDAQGVPQERPRALAQRPDRLELERPLPDRRELARRAGQHEDTPAAEREQQPGRGARRGNDRRRARHERLLAVAVAVERRIAAAPARVLGGDGGDGDEQLLVQHKLGAGRLGHRLDRAVVVGRPEPAGGDDEVVTGQLAHSCGDLVVRVSHDAHAP